MLARIIAVAAALVALVVVGRLSAGGLRPRPGSAPHRLHAPSSPESVGTSVLFIP
jgi:hypothetical protein